ncbi:MAG: Rne/Rng family ribonuclease [Alphaproteobacteria bacterium]|nr:Rne/Rng family ribonuclease [Alphaproteobacteria bacterium]
MAKRMLIDATHPEETRVVVLNGNRLEEFDFESSTKKQVKGNIYLAKVIRVEPSLQAAFVDYGNHRHGFLAFSEIHPDYYKIPVGDREPNGLDPAHEEGETREAEPEAAGEEGVSLAAALPEPVSVPATPEGSEDEGSEAAESDMREPPDLPRHHTEAAGDGEAHAAGTVSETPPPEEGAAEAPCEPALRGPEGAATGAATPKPATATTIPTVPPTYGWEEPTPAADVPVPDTEKATAAEPAAADTNTIAATSAGPDDVVVSAVEFLNEAQPDMLAAAEESTTAALAESEVEAEAVETLGGDEFEEAEHQRSRTIWHYKIQEVIKRRQIMLVQVTKEERGTKGAALTTYLSLAGRYCVLMPNTARGGGVSRKITSIADRRRLKDILEELDIPEGMGVIVRTAGAERSKAEIKRDYEYLLRLWNEIRELTLRSTAPALIYEEGNLIKRSIRDLYTRDIDEVLVEGEEGYRTAKAFMKMVMPSHAKRVQPYRDPQIGLLHRFQVESQIDAIHSPIVQLRSGGYVVINQTEALVAIDVNSGRSTRERNIEETAVRTNLEAAEEIARQLRLRDLAGLIVIDFIDMEEHRNQSAVERRLKEALKNDRARIQVGRISAFGLLEMSRQRLRPSLVETSTQPCPHCGGTGFIRSTESTALYVLRSIEEEGMRRRSAEICVHVPTAVALYILNQKRDSLVQLEARYAIRVLVAQDDALIPPAFRLERLRAYAAAEPAALPAAPLTQTAISDEEEEEIDEAAEASDVEQESGEGHGRSRRRRRRRRRHEEEPASQSAVPTAQSGDGLAEDEADLVGEHSQSESEETDGDEESDAERRRRRRGRRGGRRRVRRDGGGVEPGFEEPRPAVDTVEILPTPEVEESEQTLVEARTSWPDEIGAVAIETASLPALAGDGQASNGNISAADDSEPGAARDVERTGYEPPHPQPPREAPDGERERPSGSLPTAEAEQGVPYTRGMERELEPASAELEQQHKPEPAHPVETVTEKPANPRRGWWQRLIQS